MLYEAAAANAAAATRGEAAWWAAILDTLRQSIQLVGH
tara:strand:- start:240 stop:353 length:114 start_codon:yes stop_codon:yes gene_type:complete